MKKFGDCEVRYGVAIDHDAYRYLRLGLEIANGQNTVGVVTLAAMPVGEIVTTDHKTFKAYRYKTVRNKVKKISVGKADSVGLAMAKVISDLL